MMGISTPLILPVALPTAILEKIIILGSHSLPAGLGPIQMATTVRPIGGLQFPAHYLETDSEAYGEFLGAIYPCKAGWEIRAVTMAIHQLG